MKTNRFLASLAFIFLAMCVSAENLRNAENYEVLIMEPTQVKPISTGTRGGARSPVRRNCPVNVYFDRTTGRILLQSSSEIIVSYTLNAEDGTIIESGFLWFSPENQEESIEILGASTFLLTINGVTYEGLL